MRILKQKVTGIQPPSLLYWVRLWAVLFLVVSGYFCTLWAGETRVSITQHRGFEQLRYQLETMVETEGKGRVCNHFFVATYSLGSDFTYMFWREGRALWILELGDANPNHWKSVITTPRSGTRINLDQDVVDDPGTSNYLVETAWVKNTIYDAVLNGDIVVINKKYNFNGGR